MGANKPLYRQLWLGHLSLFAMICGTFTACTTHNENQGNRPDVNPRKNEITGEIVTIKGKFVPRDDLVKTSRDIVYFDVSHVGDEALPDNRQVALSVDVLNSYHADEVYELKVLRQKQASCEITGYYNGAFQGVPRGAHEFLGPSATIVPPDDFGFDVWFEVLKISDLPIGG